MIQRRIVEVRMPPESVADWFCLVRLECGHVMLALFSKRAPQVGESGPCLLCAATMN